ncbi:MAG: SMC-Scp complex subunit ScpB, partial [Gammaproteobacteria bacterium]|nr:SMC-Scp complex subunit ScpB [Gammaproteobacteria bacterium]
MRPALKYIVEAALLAAGGPLKVEQLGELFEEGERPSKQELYKALHDLADDYAERGIEIKEVASGWRIQVGEAMAPWVGRL